MKKILYMHTGSGNHGCEAIVRSSSKIMNGPDDLILWSFTKSEDEKYGASKVVEDIVVSEQIKRFSLSYVEAFVRRKFMHDVKANMKVFLRNLFKNNIAISIGGDNYCYEWSANQGIELNKEIRKHCKYSVLWGCSIDPEVITEAMREDLAVYDLITAREAITYETLKKINPNTVKVADPAFQLDLEEWKLPEYFVENNTVGINISPLIMKYGTEENVILNNYKNLVRYIIEETDMNICFIPHVVWEYNNDMGPIQLLYDKFKDTKRVSLVTDGNCQQLKWLISKCRFFVGARTHATIAAYSTYVPTLVVGYSVKSRGIAIDLFGTEENYVLPVQKLKTEEELKNKFNWIINHEIEIQDELREVIPVYKTLSQKAGEYINCLK